MSSIKKLSIDQQFAEIGVHSSPARMRISRPAMQMKITTQSPRMEVSRKAPSFKMNRKKINSESGLKPPVELSKSYRDAGRTGALKGTRNAGDEGDFLGNQKIPGDRLAKLSRQKTMAAATKKQDLNIGLMPKTSPEVVWDKGSMSINWSKHSIVIDWDGEYMPQVTIDPKYSIEIYLRTEPYFRVRVEDLVDPSRPGRYVDQAI